MLKTKITALSLAVLLLWTAAGFHPSRAAQPQKPLSYQSGSFSYTLNEEGEACIKGWTGAEDTLSVPATLDSHPVTAIGARGFYLQDKLISISLPNSLTAIGDDAFAGCVSLLDINLPDSLLNIGDKAFARCSKLSEISLPQGLLSLGESAFYACFSLTQISLPDSLTQIGDAAFSWCDALIEIKLPDSLTALPHSLFSGCAAIKSVTLPDTLTLIGHNAFSGCTSLTGISLPEGLTTIGDSAFSWCDALDNISLPEGLLSLGNSAFYGCSALSSISIPLSLATIGDNAFHGCEDLTITCVKDSPAQAYAEKESIPYQFFEDLTHQSDKGEDLDSKGDTSPASGQQNLTFTTFPLITPNRSPAAASVPSLYVIPFQSYIPNSTASVTFDDRYFIQDAAKENLPLAHTSMALSSTVYAQGKTEEALEMLGFQDVWAVDYDRRATPFDNNFVGLTIARKAIAIDGQKMNVFAVVCRGTYKLEWLSNFNLGKVEEQTEHQGFSLAAQRAQDALETYYGACLDAGVIVDDITTTAVWLMGHSRGGAAANLLAASLNQTKTIAKEDKVFAFTFATPNVSRGLAEHRSGYRNIRNYINPRDIITRVPLSRSGWGYWRYGRDITLSSRVEKQIAQRFHRYSDLPYQPFSYLTLEITLAALHKIAPSWQDYYGVQSGYESIVETPDSLAAAFELLAYILANALPDNSTKENATPDGLDPYSGDPISQLLEMILPKGKPPTELEHAHTLHTYLLFLEVLAERSAAASL